jgi:tripartite ATP-independent transporter DctM subunit
LSATTSGLIIAGIILVLLASGVWVSVSLLAGSIIGMFLFSSAPVSLIMSRSYWSALNGFTLTSLPLFIWMGEILFRSRVADDLFHGLTPWLGRVPGGILHVNVLGSSIFASVSGSSAATVATVGKISLPELKSRGYDERMSIGSLAAAGSLGLLIPPSIVMIVYGVTAKVSVVRLFIAGILPGLLVALFLMGYIYIWASLHPSRRAKQAIASMTWVERIGSLGRLFPVVLLIIVVIGSIYAGYATPTEAATIGVVGALLLSLATGSLNPNSFYEGLIAALRTSCMIEFIIGSASFLTSLMGYTGIPRSLALGIGELGLSAHPLLAVLTVLFIALGCFLDGISIVVLTSAIIIPMLKEVNIDLLWFGIYLVLVVEIAQITPPVGFNLFVAQSLTNRSILYVARAALPFFAMILLAIATIIVFPVIATWLPSTMY